MTLPDLLADLGGAGVTLRAVDGGVRFSPRSAMRADRAAGLTARKAAVLAMLIGGYDPADPDTAYILSERLATGADLGMPTGIGSAGWMIAAGAAMAPCCTVATCGVYSPHGPIDRTPASDPKEPRCAGRDRDAGGTPTVGSLPVDGRKVDDGRGSRGDSTGVGVADQSRVGAQVERVN